MHASEMSLEKGLWLTSLIFLSSCFFPSVKHEKSQPLTAMTFFLCSDTWWVQTWQPPAIDKMFYNTHRTDMCSSVVVQRYCKAVFFNPGPRDPLPCMFSMFPSSTTPDLNEWLLIRPLQSLMTSWSFESGVVETWKTCRVVGPEDQGWRTLL